MSEKKDKHPPKPQMLNGAQPFSLDIEMPYPRPRHRGLLYIMPVGTHFLIFKQ